ncbi:polysaccharide deacetylase family protein [Bradyrhizobium sp.]|uniref:polysaccharide deacetylase family protein n=1 Tax=Bradyrhizobium sp. TaxID=376 RepID=UPI00238AA5B6|nr:polysaccharide deacetylase family protein [Bradyrhizobium sp.]MDE2379675.1 polysaccharide deacetylase family protein [Bradyrhizobium sp.]
MSLTFDDALPVHHELAGPALEARGLRGSFYLHIATAPSRDPLPWRALAARGHELGNHTLFHPCRGRPGWDWLDPAFDLRRYTPLRFQQEVRVANAFLTLIDGRPERTFACTCYDTHLGQGRNRAAIAELIRSDFVAARGRRTDKPITVTADLDLMNLDCLEADGLPLAALVDAVDETRDRGGWLIAVFHGIGSGTHHLFSEPTTLNALLDHLAAARDVWVAPLIEIAKWVRGG